MAQSYTISATGSRYELSRRPRATGAPPDADRRARRATLDERGVSSVPYQMEENRGYQWVGSLWSPGYFRADATRGPIGLADRVGRAVGDA